MAFSVKQPFPHFRFISNTKGRTPNIVVNNTDDYFEIDWYFSFSFLSILDLVFMVFTVYLFFVRYALISVFLCIYAMSNYFVQVWVEVTWINKHNFLSFALHICKSFTVFEHMLSKIKWSKSLDWHITVTMILQNNDRSWYIFYHLFKGLM
jgi:hypothetical protein